MSNSINPKFNADQKLFQWVDIFWSDMNKMNDFFNSKLTDLINQKDTLTAKFNELKSKSGSSSSGTLTFKNIGVFKRVGDEKDWL